MLAASRPEMLTETREGGEEDILSLKDLLRIVRRRLWVIALTVLAFTAIATGYSLAQTPMFEASARLLLVVQEQTEQSGQRGPAPSSAVGDTQAIQLLSETMAQAVQNEDVANTVVRRLGIERSPSGLLDSVRVNLVPNTNLIEVVVADPDPATARDVANAFGEAAADESIPINRTANNSVTATVWEKAQTPTRPVEPQPSRDGLVGLVLGLMLGVGLVFLLEYLDGTLRSPAEAESSTGIPVLGMVPIHRPAKGKGLRGGRWNRLRGKREVRPASLLDGDLITVADPTSPAAEAHRNLRSMLLHATLGTPPKVVVLAGAGGGDDASDICANLGVALSQAGKRTLILDCDFRAPAMERIFALNGSRGMTEALSEGLDLEEVGSEPLPGLKVVPAGSAPPDPGALLEAESFLEFLAEVEKEFDHVLIDAPSFGTASDAVSLSVHGDAVLLVVRARKTEATALTRTVHSLQALGANVLGLVVSGVEARGRKRAK